FKKAMRKSQLSEEERELASLLLENGARLAQNPDPVSEIEDLSTVADKLVENIKTAAKGKDKAAIDRYARLQGKVNKRGLNARLAKLEDTGVAGSENEKRVEKVVLRESKRTQAMLDLLERNPDLSPKELRKELDPRNHKLPTGLVFDLEGKDSAALGESVPY